MKRTDRLSLIRRLQFPLALGLAALLLLAWAVELRAEGPAVTIDLGGAKGQTSVVMQILGLLTVLSLAPAMLIMVTSFTRIVIVLSFLRRALATQQLPPNQVVTGMALFLTFLVMAPTWGKGWSASCLRP